MKTRKDILRCLTLVSEMLGLKMTEDEILLNEYTKYIQEEFSDFELQEFVLAAKLYSKGVYYFELNHKMSVLFLEKLMKEYRKYRFINKTDNLLTEGTLTKSEADRKMDIYYKNLLRKHKAGETNEFSYTFTMFDYLEGQGIIKTDPIKMEEFIELSKVDLKKYYQSKDYDKNIRNVLKNFIEHLNLEDTKDKLVRMAKSKYLQWFIETKI